MASVFKLHAKVKRRYGRGVLALQLLTKCMLVTALFLALPVCLVFAEQRELKSEGFDKVDAVLLLDSSGSMRITDPGRLRDEGAKLFIQFLKFGDRVGIVEFDREGRVIRPLTEFRQDILDSLGYDIGRVGNSGLYTDIYAGLQTARKVLEESPRKDANKIIVLLSDGKMDPDPKNGSAEKLTDKLLNDLLPELKAEGIKVHTLSFSDQADKDLLSQIAAATDGMNWFTPTADKIHESYAELFLVVKKPQIVPLTSKGFRIDPDIQEATFYINRENAQ
ncbi:MAG: VWA domain-containing protein [Candidatus Dadabacteria bacterium]|nr:MAG: VWA domain-containing protein [Candidatus Dadabacteria bacterium]